MTAVSGRPSGWVRWVPGLVVARTYQRRWLARDVGAGLVLSTVLVPAGMAYAQAAGLPPVHGLYATIVPLLVYAVLGPSRILVVGPDSSLAPLIAAAILPLAGADPSQRVALAGALAVLSGLLCLAAGLARFGFLTDLLSNPVRYGYTNGIAVIIILGQLPRALGFSTDARTVPGQLGALVDGVLDGATRPAAVVVAGVALAAILVLRRWRPAVPGVLVAVVGAIVAVSLLRPDGLALVGDLPRGLPRVAVPAVDLADLGALLAGAVAIAFVSFADTSLLSRTFAARGHYEVDPNQELVALGAANVASGLTQGFAVSSSLSRTPVAEAAGARTQLTGVVGALAVTVMLVAAPGLFRNLPTAVLAAVVIAAALRLVEVAAVVRLARVRPGELVLCLACFAGVVVLGVIPGIGLAVALGLLDFVRRAWRPHTAELVRVDGLKGYHDAARHPEGRRVPGLVLYRFDAPLFFANAGFFRQEVRRLVAAADPPARWLVVTAEPVTDVDTTAADMLAELVDELRAAGVTLAFAELKGVVRERLARYGLVAKVGEERFFRTVGEAVKAYVAATGTPWVDWEERGDHAP